MSGRISEGNACGHLSRHFRCSYWSNFVEESLDEFHGNIREEISEEKVPIQSLSVSLGTISEGIHRGREFLEFIMKSKVFCSSHYVHFS